jgi:hypothetical protein
MLHLKAGVYIKGEGYTQPGFVSRTVTDPLIILQVNKTEKGHIHIQLADFSHWHLKPCHVVQLGPLLHRSCDATVQKRRTQKMPLCWMQRRQVFSGNYVTGAFAREHADEPNSMLDASKVSVYSRVRKQVEFRRSPTGVWMHEKSHITIICAHIYFNRKLCRYHWIVLTLPWSILEFDAST